MGILSMKKRLFFYLFLINSFGFSQKNNENVIQVDSLPDTVQNWGLLATRTSLYSLKLGVLLDKGWRWQSGDKAEYAKNNFDDSHWENINPAQNFNKIPNIKKGIGWFRLHLRFSSKLDRKLALLIEQNGASEIYLNGKLVKKNGTLSKEAKLIKAFNPANLPIPITLDSSTNQILAIRFAFEPDVHYSTVFFDKNYALKIQINKLQTAIENHQKISQNFFVNSSIRVGIFIFMAILHLAFYLFYPSKKANLFLSLYAMASILSYYEQIRWFSINDLQARYVSSLVSFNANSINYVLLLIAFYYLLDQKRGKIFWFLIGLASLSLPLSIFVYGWGWMVGGLLLNTLTNLEIARVVFISIKNKQKGTWILGIGAFLFLIFWVIFNLQNVFGMFLWMSGIPFTIAVLGIPFVTSIYLGLEFGFTNNSLSQRLIENQVLTEQVIIKENEKHQILKTQNETLEKQVKARTAELLASQAQLIQSEKLASLGELTAGIAHEIQNPLNFVNNFSELSEELIDEMNDEIDKGNNGEVKAIASDLKLNLEKIHHHGKRASSIVKGMLEHSRISTGDKELTDINALADEYLRLAYHGLRAKDSTGSTDRFNSDFKTDFDENLPKIEVIPQDIGRVLLNLINNAFYACAERSRSSIKSDEKSLVLVSTKKTENQVVISVKDNGNGMSDEVKAKIFQPFFTTKPTGQGTGLGLSLAYDIITKGHGGTLEVESKEGEGTEFIIRLNM